MGLYLYGVVPREPAVSPQRFGAIGLPDPRGEPQAVGAVGAGDLVILTSSFEQPRVMPVRQNLQAHHAVVRAAFERTTVLPMKFGHVVGSEAAVKQLLQSHREAFLEQLERVRGNVEMGLRVCWDVENIFEYFVSRHRALRDFRDRIFGRSSAPSRGEQIELGQLFDRIRDQERREHAARVLEVFEDLAEEHQEGPLRDDKAVLSLAFLVPRGSEAAFEKRVHQAAGLFDAAFAFDFNGPWPPLSFVELELELPGVRSRPERTA